MKTVINSHIQLFQSHWWQLNSTLCNKDSTTLVWDPAYDPAELETISIHSNQSDSNTNFLLFTHGDYDHVVGETFFPGYKKLGSSGMDDRKNKEDVIKQVENNDHEFYIERKKNVSFPELDIKITALNPTVMILGNLEVHFYHAGGHTVDGLFTIVPELGLWVAGDYLSDIEFPFIEDQLEDYRNTLDRSRKILKEYRIDCMVPGHGQPARDHAEINLRIDQSEKYIDSLSEKKDIADWRDSWGYSPFHLFLDKMHTKNINHVRASGL